MVLVLCLLMAPVLATADQPIDGQLTEFRRARHVPPALEHAQYSLAGFGQFAHAPGGSDREVPISISE